MNIENLSASEFLQLVADALYATHTPRHQVCQEEGCNNTIKKGVRCDGCALKKRKQQDHAYEERRRRAKAQEKAVQDEVRNRSTSPKEET